MLRILAAGLAVLLFAAPVRAESRQRSHDGLFLRLGLGGGGLKMVRAGDVNFVDAPHLYGHRSYISGACSSGELSLGGNLTPRLVLAGSFLTHQRNNAVLERDDGSTEDLPEPLRFLVLGAALLYYPDPDRGFHFGGSLGLALAVTRAPPNVWNVDYLGGGGVAGAVEIGHAWWVSSQWSLGGLVRATGARVRGEKRVAGVIATEVDNVGALVVMLQAQYH